RLTCSLSRRADTGFQDEGPEEDTGRRGKKKSNNKSARRRKKVRSCSSLSASNDCGLVELYSTLCLLPGALRRPCSFGGAVSVSRLTQQQCRGDFPLLSDQHVVGAASRAEIHRLETDPTFSERCAHCSGRKPLTHSRPEKHDFGRQREDLLE